MIKVNVYPKNDGNPFSIFFNDNEVEDVKTYTNRLAKIGHDFIVMGLPKLSKDNLD